MTRVTALFNRTGWRKPVIAGASRASAGFTLTEMAIVLGVVGIVFGQVWSAAGAVYKARMVADYVNFFQEIESSIPIKLSTVSIGGSDISLTDSCGSTCGSDFLFKQGVLPGFILSTKAPDPTGTVPYPLYRTRDGAVIWAGLENSTVYSASLGACGGGGCGAGSTIVEIDLLGISADLCVSLLSALINGQLKGFQGNSLDGIAAPNMAWGNELGPTYSGSTAMPASITSAQAVSACGANSGALSWISGTSSYLWLFFSVTA